MYNGCTVGAIIVAAGKGRRMGKGINKQYIMIDDRPVLYHTLSVFQSCSIIDSIVVVVGKDEVEYCINSIIDRYGIKKVLNVVEGGEERQHSIMNGLDALKGISDIIVTHDGARPFVTEDIVDKSVYEAGIYGAATCGVPVKDTIKIGDADNFIAGTPERSRLYAVQTPQAFKFDLIYKAHILARDDNFLGTDDTMLLERMGFKVKLFPGSYENIKITTPEDIFIAEAIIKYRKKGQAD